MVAHCVFAGSAYALQGLLPRLLSLAAPGVIATHMPHAGGDDQAAQPEPCQQQQQHPTPWQQQQQQQQQRVPLVLVQDEDALRLACHIFQLALQDPFLAEEDSRMYGGDDDSEDDDDDGEEEDEDEQQDLPSAAGRGGVGDSGEAQAHLLRPLCRYVASVCEGGDQQLRGLPVLLYGLYRWDMPASRALGAGSLAAALQLLLVDALKLQRHVQRQSLSEDHTEAAGAMMRKLPLVLQGLMCLAEAEGSAQAAAAPRPVAGARAPPGGDQGGRLPGSTTAVPPGVPAVGEVVAMACRFMRASSANALALARMEVDIQEPDEFPGSDVQDPDWWVGKMDEMEQERVDELLDSFWAGCLAAAEACGRPAWAAHAPLAQRVLKAVAKHRVLCEAEGLPDYVDEYERLRRYIT